VLEYLALTVIQALSPGAPKLARIAFTFTLYGDTGVDVCVQLAVKFWVTLPVPPDGALTVTVDGLIVHCILGGLN
jgi:hypothetical protein